MKSNSDQKCCNGNCNQGDECPLREEIAQNNISLMYRIHNFVYNLPLNFTLAEWIGVTLAVMLLFITFL